MNNDSIGEIIRREREKRDWSRVLLGRKADLDPSYIYRLETGRVKSPGIESIERIANAFGMSPNELLKLIGKHPARVPSVQKLGPVILVPVVNISLAAGSAVYGETNETVPIPADVAPGHRLVASKVTGDCMEPDIRDGDTVIIDLTNHSPRPGQLVAVLMEDGNMMVKRFEQINGIATLIDNKGNEYFPNGAKIQGVAVWSTRKLP